MLRQNRAVPILMVLTIAWLLYLGGCFGGDESANELETTDGQQDTPAIAPTPTPPPLVTEAAETTSTESPLWHTIQEGDLLPTIAATYSVPEAVILRANPDLDPDLLLVGERLLIPGASVENDVEEEIAEARSGGESIDHVVVEGETLGSIALEWAVSVEAIEQANPEVDANALQVNQLLVIPPRGTGLSDEELARLTPVEPVERDPFETLYHVVQPGDLLLELATRYSVTVDEIIIANGLADANQIGVGQELAIPPPSSTSDSDATDG